MNMQAARQTLRSAWPLLIVVVVLGIVGYRLRFAPVQVRAAQATTEVVISEILGTGTLESRVHASVINRWPDVTVHTAQGQRDLLLSGMIDKARRQLGLFRVILVVISTIIMALILYTLTLDKIHDIALLKLMGARNQVIISLIMHQALFLGAIGYGIAYLLGLWTFPRFPRRVLVTGEELWALAVIVFVISVLSSLLGIVKAMRIAPDKVLS